MNKLALASLMLLITCSLLASPPPGAPTDKDPAAYQGIGKDDISRLKKGELVILKNVSGDQSTAKGMVKAAIIFNQPLEKTWELFTQGWRQEEYLPYLD